MSVFALRCLRVRMSLHQCGFCSRSVLSAHWLNFHDPESRLLSMEWHAGTSPGQSDILAATRLHVTVEMITNLTQPLPLGRKVYVTLKVFNKAGGRGSFLHSEHTVL